MIRCWILIGGPGVRKGSVVRALTGVGTGRDCQIALRNGQWLYLALATISSINENNPPDPDEWVSSQSAAAPSVRNLLVSFQLNGRSGFDAEDYVQSLDGAGADIRSIITLGAPTPAWVPPYGAPYASIPDSAITPTALTAKMVRMFWDWQ
jgi:hypothetical protein